MKTSILSFVALLVGCTTMPFLRPEQSSDRQAFISAAQAIDSDELIVMRDGNIVVRWNSERYPPRHQIMSIAKSVVGLAIGTLFDDGRLRLGDTLDRFYPELHGDPRGKITLDDIMTMTSGLGSNFLKGDVDTDCIAEALRQPLEHPPGTKFFYNNDAVNLLSGVVERVTGGSLEAHVRHVLFEPLEIKDWTWAADSKGHTWVMAGLAMRAEDLAKIGELVAKGGAWKGHQVVSASWLEGLSSGARTDHYGRLWFTDIGCPGKSSAPSGKPKERFIWANGDFNQALMIDRWTNVVVVIQTERVKRGMSAPYPPEMSPLEKLFCRFTSK